MLSCASHSPELRSPHFHVWEAPLLPHDRSGRQGLLRLPPLRVLLAPLEQSLVLVLQELAADLRHLSLLPLFLELALQLGVHLLQVFDERPLPVQLRLYPGDVGRLAGRHRRPQRALHLDLGELGLRSRLHLDLGARRRPRGPVVFIL